MSPDAASFVGDSASTQPDLGVADTWVALTAEAGVGDGSSSNPGVFDAGALVDQGVADTVVPTESGPTDSGPLPTCAPANMTPYTPPAYKPARPAMAACTAALVQKYYSDCLSGTDCSAFRPGGLYAACGSCMQPSAAEDANYGPVVQSRSGTITAYETNIAGCIELLGELDCAKKIQAATVCDQQACAQTCPVSDSASYQRSQSCEAAARAGTCAPVHAATSCIAVPAHVTACNGNSFAEQVALLGKVFCVGQ